MQSAITRKVRAQHHADRNCSRLEGRCLGLGLLAVAEPNQPISLRYSCHLRRCNCVFW